MNKVTISGVDTSLLPRLSQKQSTELLQRIKYGDDEARELFIFANMRLVLSVVGRFQRQGDYADDYFQVGMVGLLKALNNFDSAYGVTFSTYAVPMIIGEIKRAMRDRTGIKVSRNLRDTAYQALRTRELMTENGYMPDILEIAEEIGIPLKDVSCALDAVSDTISFNEPVYNEDGEGMLLLDKLPDEKETTENWTERLSLHEALKCVPERELNVIRLRYFEGKTQTEISTVVGISQAQVSRLEKSALERIRKALA